MTIFNFGSINIDHVYQVPHFVRPGETLTSRHYQKILGGKGANQSIALAKANSDVVHVGAIAQSDNDLLAELAATGVNTQHIALLSQPTGHAIIQVNRDGENAIVLFPGANHALTTEQIENVLSQSTADDWLLLQNETNHIETIITSAKNRGLTLIYNPAPMNKTLVEGQIANIDILIVNEVEAMDLFGVDSVGQAQAILQRDYPALTIVMTLGARGVRYIHGGEIIDVAAFNVEAIDTTAAGDTFIGYCLAGLMSSGLAAPHGIQAVLSRACAASAICVTRDGASSSIPTQSEVTDFLKDNTAKAKAKGN